MHEVIAEVAGNLIPVDVSVSAGEAIPVEVGGGSGGGGGGGLTNAAKDALLQIARKAVYVDAGGQTYYNALYEALYPLVSISATFTQSGTIYADDPLSDLVPMLTVTATYGDGGTAEVPSTDYTLSGTLAVGTSTVTVTYEGKTATFTVTVSAEPATLSSITAVYTQSGTVYDTDSLDSLKTDLVVTAHYSDSTSETVASADYTLSGTLTAGTSTITVTYEGKTDTFSVTVTASKAPIYNFDLTQSATDSVGGVVSSGTASRDSSGLHFTQNDKYWDFGEIYDRNRTYEIDVLSHEQNGHGGTNAYGRLFAVDTDSATSSGGSCVIFTGNKRTTSNSGKAGWALYCGSGWDNALWSNIDNADAGNNYNDSFFDGKTIQVKVSSTGYVTVRYKTIGADDSTYVTLVTSTVAFKAYTNGHVYAGSSGAGADYLQQTTITGLRVYEGVS